MNTPVRILNTRPDGQAEELNLALKKLGFTVIQIPAIAIEPCTSSNIKNLELYKIQKAIFISPNAVKYFFAQLQQSKIPWPNHIMTIAIGQASAMALTQQQIRVDVVPLVADSENLLGLECLNNIRDEHILLIKGVGGRTLIPEVLSSRGAMLTELSVYRRVIPTTNKKKFAALWQDNAVDLILFTSETAIVNTFELFGTAAHPWLCTKPCIVISERLAKTAQTLGIQTIITSSYDKILASIQAFIQGTK